MKWVHEFYQRNPDDNSNDLYYFSQREARAVLESVRTIKKGYYEAKVIAIESDESFRIMHVGGGCTHQYRIGDKFTLRQHKNKKVMRGFVTVRKDFGTTQDFRVDIFAKGLN